MRTEAIKTITIAILLFIIWIMSTCNNPCPKIKDGGTTVVHKTDTIYKFMQVPVKIPVYINKPTAVYDTIHQSGDSVRVYDNVYEDTNIKGTIHSVTIGKLAIQDFTYKFKNPITTTIRDSIFITKTLIIDSTKKSRTQLGIGLQVTYPYTMISPNIFVKSKNNSIFGVGYDVINKNYSVQFIKILNFRK